jgi:5-formyltetrahydrofolate cyclo-ligase
MPETGRWAERHPGKDIVREEVWTRLGPQGVSVWRMIPTFVGAEIAAWRLAQSKRARTDPHPQIPILSRLHERLLVGRGG